jgi:hypothetical protein
VLSSIAFNTIVNGISIAPVASNGIASLLPVSTSSLSLVGRLVPQDSQQGLDTVSAIFNNFIHGKDSNVMVQGASAGPSDVRGLFDFPSHRLIIRYSVVGNLAQRRNSKSSNCHCTPELGPTQSDSIGVLE